MAKTNTSFITGHDDFEQSSRGIRSVTWDKEGILSALAENEFIQVFVYDKKTDQKAGIKQINRPTLLRHLREYSLSSDTAIYYKSGFNPKIKSKTLLLSLKEFQDAKKLE